MTIKPAHRRIVTILVGVVVLVVFLVAGMTLRVPYVALGPGPTVNTIGESPDGDRVVRVDGAVDPDPKGHLNLTTVSVHDGLTLFQSLGMWVSGSYELQPRETYYPPDQSEDEVRRQNDEQMAGSEIDATTAALTYLKMPSAVGVAAVAEKGPSAGKIKPFDRIVAVGGTPVNDAESAIAEIGDHAPGESVDVTLQRGPRRLVESVTLGRGSTPKKGERERGTLGVTIMPMSADPNVNIRFNVGQIGGPSAGLMLTLSLIDYMTPGDLSHDTFVAGTGTIKTDGRVGAIGGIQHKIKAADEAGASIFLVPEDNCSEAVAGAPDDIELVKVGTLTDAVTALGTIGSDKSRPHCS
ncbi:YlbL family protein [Gordonia shandongensis]|uniref:YlbL family protein n=1 Tax=Gordonia shandongensis TaxID=376351 RepID=UPI00047B5F7C|nr:S16 family serine protease [Gordonia shandongensis]